MIDSIKKFRVWHEICHNFGHFKVEDGSHLHINGAPEQFTGLLDRNGNEIYEGDFLRRVCGGHKHFEHLATYLVSFDEEMAKFRFIKVGYDGELAPSHVRECYEIVGNIHENEELLNA